MKIVVHIARLLVGCLFIFSGLVKAIDPLGLGYKMQEFFEVWASDGYFPSLMNYLHDQSLWFSVTMIVFEILLGVALLIGWRKKLVSILLLLLTLFFTFLTGFVLFTGKIRACGCFGDCIPLTPIQTFTKDIVLTVLIIILLIYNKHISPIFKNTVSFVILFSVLVGSTFLQGYVLKYLPLKDCLPYRKGNNILELRKMPEGAIPDQYDYIFIYEKGGVKKEFSAADLPDSSWAFSERIQKLIAKGINNIPLINDFTLADSTGVSLTEDILGQSGSYYLFFLQNLQGGTSKWWDDFKLFHTKAQKLNRPVYIITSDREKVNTLFNVTNNFNIDIMTCDATAIKTAARANPTIYSMTGPVVQEKYSWADLEKVIK